jgi:hypothetical protein
MIQNTKGPDRSRATSHCLSARNSLGDQLALASRLEYSPCQLAGFGSLDHRVAMGAGSRKLLLECGRAQDRPAQRLGARRVQFRSARVPAQLQCDPLWTGGEKASVRTCRWHLRLLRLSVRLEGREGRPRGGGRHRATGRDHRHCRRRALTRERRARPPLRVPSEPV